MIVVQAIRAIHRIVTDGGEYKNLNTRRKEYARMYYRALFDSAETLKVELTNAILFGILKLNVEVQSYYPELNDSIEKTINEIKLRKNVFEEDRSTKGV